MNGHFFLVKVRLKGAILVHHYIWSIIMNTLFFWSIIACGEKTTDTSSTSTEEPSTEGPITDIDGDGFAADIDCNDEDANIFPGSVAESSELCLLDGDGDGFGDANAPSPYDAGSDCNDADGFTFPGAAENESDSLCQTDADEDGYGSSTPAAGVESGLDGFDTNPDLWIVPTQGVWDLAEETNVVNNCDIDEDTGTAQGASSMTLTSTGDASFQLSFDDSTDTTDCTLSGSTFSCNIPNTNESVTVPVLDDDITVDLQFSTSLTGTFTSGSVLNADFALTVSCTGTDNLFISCSALSDYLPCDASWTLPATAQ